MRASIALVLFGVCLVLSGCGSSSKHSVEKKLKPNQPGLDVQTLNCTLHGKQVGATRAFLGIPFAAPPVGKLRWRAPQPAEACSGTRDATQYAPACTHINNTLTKSPSVAGSEDCLYLNVWSPDPAPAELRPVMVWFTGGAFRAGSGEGLWDGEEDYPGTSLVPAGNVVLVTVNYRVGAFGFWANAALDAEDPSHPTSGNYGFEDQQFALQWVKDNIVAFGGDPHNVTIFGNASGGTSACIHMVAPGSRGLFSKAIMESGLCDLLVESRDDAETNGKALASKLGCADSKTQLECMRGKDADTILTAQMQLRPQALFVDTGVNWGPTVDGHVIPDTPMAMLERGDFQKVPVLLGSNFDEGTLFVASKTFQNLSATDYPTYVDNVKNVLGVDASVDVVSEYPVADYNGSPFQALRAVVGEGALNCPTRRQARAFAKAGVPVYLYDFTHATPIPKQWLQGDGAFHTSEVPFIFQAKYLGYDLSSDEKKLSDEMEGYWTRMATTGDPNGGGAPQWPSYDKSGDKDLHLDLSPNTKTESGLRKDKCDWWRGVTPPQ